MFRKKSFPQKFYTKLFQWLNLKFAWELFFFSSWPETFNMKEAEYNNSDIYIIPYYFPKYFYMHDTLW